MTMRGDPLATILNVDDTEGARYAKSRILRQAHFDVAEAGTGLEALTLARERRFDLVLLDVKLPDIDGYEVCRRLRADPHTATVAVLQTSASFVDLDSRVRALDGGADNYLTAPFEPEVLIASVRALLRLRTAESELHAARAAFRATFEESPIAIAHVGEEGRWLRVNERLLQLLLRSAPPEGSFLECVAPAERAAVELGLHRLLSGELATFGTELQLIDSVGNLHVVNLTAAPVLLGESGSYAILLLEDIHARKQAETALRSHQTALRESEERFRQFADNTRDVLWIYDRRARQYEYVSRAYSAVWEREPGTALEDAERWLEAVVPEDREAVRQSRDEGTSKGAAVYRILRPDGEQRWIDDRTFSIPAADGGIGRIAGIAQDVTERMQAAEQLAQLLASERAARVSAEQSSQIKEQFLATLSHELRTPLNAILGWTQLLRQHDRSPAEFVEGLKVIERNARAQTLLISDLLDVSSIVAGKIRLEFDAVDLRALVATAVDGFRPDAQARGVELRVRLTALEEPFFADAARVQQIVWNLVSNAVKFTPVGGEVDVSLEPRSGVAEIRVRDTGEGIPPEFLPRIFERFSQADPSLSRSHGGLGLGLSIVRSLAELHGGRVHASSPGKGGGSTFIVELPLGPRREHDAELAPPRREIALTGDALAGVRVLLVDDELDARELARQVLAECGADVCSVASASEALRAALEFDPDILLSDIGLPEMDGYMLLRAVRAQSSRRITAVALTAYAREEDRERALREGYQAHLPKPVEPRELVRTLAGFRPSTGPT
jgi:PAS domain S-box-containing protein